MKRFLFILLFFFIIFSHLHGESLTADPPPRKYNHNSSITLELTDYDADIYYFFEESDDRTPVKYTVPVQLRALGGEERAYTIHAFAVPRGREISEETVTEEEVFSYTIDKRLPGSPSATVPSGVYYDDLIVSFQYRTDQLVYFSLIGDEQPIEITKQWSGKPLVLEGRKGAVSRYILEVFSYDDAGNKSSVRTYRYLLDKQEEEKIKQLEVISPVDGSFLNRQLLYIRHSGYSWVRYSVNGSNPASGGEPYEGPFLIPQTGSVAVRVAAFDEGAKNIVEKKINFEVDENPSEILSLGSGVYGEDKTVRKKGKGTYRISMNDTRPEEWSDTIPDNGIKLPITENAQKPIFIRLLNENSPDGPEYRYVYLMDGRIPAKPEIYLFDRTKGGSKGVEVAVLGPTYGTIYYTLDGKSPSRKSTQYTDPFFISYPASPNAQFRRIKAVTVDSHGNISEVSEKNVRIPEEKDLPPPEFEKGRKGTYSLRHPDNVDFVYEIGTDRQSLVEPSLSSPAISRTFTYSLPYGFAKTLYVQFAAVDRYKNISPPSRVLRIDIDNNPPSKPVFTYKGGKLFIESDENAEIHYVVSEDADTHPEINANSPVYEKPIKTHPEEGLKKTYTISAYAVDDEGNKSQTAGPKSFSIDLRSTSIPILSGAEEGGNYKDPVVLRFTLEKADEIILYTYTLDGSEPPDPDFTSDTADERTLLFEGRANNEVHVRLKYAAALPGPKRMGEIHNTAFIIDRDPPAIPEPVGFENRQIYTGPVYVTIPDQEDGVEYFYGLAAGNGSPPDCFGAYGQKIEDTVEFDLPKGEEKQFAVIFGAKDRAGNKVYNNTIYTFTIDKKGPSPPKPIGIPEKPINTPVEMSFDFEDGEVYYEFSEGESVPEDPSENSFLYSSPVIFKGKPDREVVYTVKVCARDSAGNFSPHSAVYSFTIDQRSPAPVGKPLVREEGDGISISWPPPKSETIFFSLAREDKRISEWEEFKEKIVVPAGELRRTVVLQAYRLDAAGNRSETASYEIWRELLDPEKNRVFSKILDGGIYNSPVTLKPYSGDQVIKYEVAFQGLEPMDVTVFSDELKRQTSFDVLPGETKVFAVKARLYDKYTKNFISEEQTVTFTIDKTPPPPPEIIVKSGDQNYFQSDVKVGINAPEGKIFYKVRELDAFNNVLREGDYGNYTEEIVLYAEEGIFKSYDIISYSVDSAGNKSKNATRSGIVIDKQIIYVSDTGNDDYPGSRAQPLQSIWKAVELASEKSRGIIMIASGTYELDKTVSLTEKLTVLGGYHPITWERNPDEPTVITEGRYLSKESSFFSCSEEEIQLSNIEFISGRKEIVPVLVDAGSARMEKIRIKRTSNAELPALRQTGGSLTIVNSSFLSETNGSGPLIEIEGADSCSFSGCIFEGAIDSGNDSTLMVVRNTGEMAVSDSTFQPGRGRTAEALYAENSTLTVKGCLLYSGSGSVRSASIHLEESDFTGTKILIQTDSSSRITSGVLAYDSEVALTKSTLQLGGEGGSVGVYTESSTLRIEASIIKGNPKSEFLHLFQAKESGLSIFNNTITSSMSGDFVGFDIERGSADIFNNTVVLEFGTGNSYFVRTVEQPDLRICNNIIIQNNRTKKGTVFYSPGKDGPYRLIANNMYGWNRIVAWEGGYVSDIEQCNGLDGNPFGGSFHKNIAESTYETFLVTKEEPVFRLKQSSACVNGGIDVSEFGGPEVDYEGDVRPNPSEGLNPAYDIGADEF